MRMHSCIILYNYFQQYEYNTNNVVYKKYRAECLCVYIWSELKHLFCVLVSEQSISSLSLLPWMEQDGEIGVIAHHVLGYTKCSVINTCRIYTSCMYTHTRTYSTHINHAYMHTIKHTQPVLYMLTQHMTARGTHR